MTDQTLAPERYEGMSDDEMRAGIREFKRKLGKRLVILGHHYQRDAVFEFADLTGDSLKLSQLAAEQTEAEYIVFCGVHFMAESADMLGNEKQAVILPDLAAGCSMADMATAEQAEAAWTHLTRSSDMPITPITYVNSSAAVKAFVGRQDGACCTSGNARTVLEWALKGAKPDGDADAGHKVLFLPDQHLGRNSAYAMGWPLDSMVVYDPAAPNGGLTAEQVRAARFILWKGHCAVHQLFTTEQIEQVRAGDPDCRIIVHPECPWEVCQGADAIGSTEQILKAVNESAPGSSWAVGTEVNMVDRLAANNPDKHVRSLAGMQCLCETMYRIDLRHLYWVLDELVAGRVVNRITVDAETKRSALTALERMLALRPDKVLK